MRNHANLTAVVAEAWARSGNSIEATELLNKYDIDDKILKIYVCDYCELEFCVLIVKTSRA